jgi:hypothetical protein
MVPKRKLALLAGLALGALGSLTTAQIAGATHPRPKGATPLLVSLVVAYQQCTTGTNRQHGPPLAALSCTSPQTSQPPRASSYLTVGTGDAWPGTQPKAIGSVRFDVKSTSPEDVKIVASLTDVRCILNSVPGFCATANTDNAAVNDYTGELNGTVTIRVTDHFNGPVGGSGGTDPATVGDVPLSIGSTCASTADTTIGGTCGVSTSANSFFPGAVQDGKRANLEAQAITIQDGGGDGLASTTFDNTPFETQGLFVP